LAKAVAACAEPEGAIVLGLPRGGVPVAYEVAHALQLPLDVIVVRKLGAPKQRELAMGAVASGGIVVMNQHVVAELHIPPEAIESAIEWEKLEVERGERAFRSDHPAVEIEGRPVILVDDGLATGASMLAAVRAVRTRSPRVVVAVPVGEETSCDALRVEVDRLVCVSMPRSFYSVAAFYRDFEQTTDEEVRGLLRQARLEQAAQRNGLKSQGT
jgi:putative phosphoribosyl transferase